MGTGEARRLAASLRRGEPASVRIGLVSDTHGLLRPEALDALRGSDHIVHAGDIGEPGILEALGRLAPVIAVRGNNDTAPWAATLPTANALVIGQVRIGVVHVLDDAARLFDARPDVVVYGHSHQPRVDARDGTWFVNPGSAGPRRFRLPVSVGEIIVEAATIRPRLITLPIPPSMPSCRR